MGTQIDIPPHPTFGECEAAYLKLMDNLNMNQLILLTIVGNHMSDIAEHREHLRSELQRIAEAENVGGE